MSTVWSSYVGGIAVGIDVSQSPSTVTSSTSSVNLTWTIWARNDSTHGTGSYTWSCSGAKSSSGSGSGGYPSWGTTWKVATFTTTVTPSYSGTVSSSLTATVTWSSTGASPRLTRAVTIAKRPPGTPSAPTSVSAAYSSGNINVSWTRPSNASSAGTIWTNVVVQRWTDSYTSAASWKTVATLSGTTTSWVDTTVSDNHQYQYQVYAKNSGGSSSAPNSPTIQTAPSAPTSVIAQRSGSDIVINWKDNSPFNSKWKVEDSADGTTWTTKSSSVAASATSYRDLAPSTSVTHRYRVTAYTANNLTAVSATTNVVALLAAPAAPSALSPSIVATGSTTSFTWQHNATDTSPQSAYQLLWSNDGGATWNDTGKITSTDSSWDATAICATAGSIQWQVRTWGGYTDPGPYGAIKTTGVSSTPSVSITAPSSSVSLASVEVDWTYTQAEGSAQTSWEVDILPQGWYQGTPIDSGSGSGTTSSWTSGTVLDNATNYTASVTVTSAAGLTATATQDFTVTYEGPPTPTIALDDNVADGYIDVTAQVVPDGVKPDPISITIERSIDDGPWVQVYADDVLSATWRDYGCSLVGVNSYRVTAISALPSQTSITTDYVSTTYSIREVVMLSTGTGLSTVIRFSWPNTADFSGGGRETVTNQFAGREFPVATHGIGKSKELQVTALLASTDGLLDDLEATREAVEDTDGIFYGSGPTLYRDSLGRRFYCILSSPAVPSGTSPVASFTVTQTDPGTVIEGIVS